MDIIIGLITFVGFVFFVIIWFLPIILIAASDKTTGKEKVAWLLAVIFVSWFAWVFYWLLAPIKKRDRYDYY